MPPIPKTTKEIEIEKNIILDSALKIVSAKGCDGLTMRALAKECNSSSTKIYYYFKNKEHILFQLEEFGFLKLKNCIEKATDKKHNPEDKFIAMLEAIYYFGTKESDFFNLMFGVNSPKFLDFFDDSTLKDVAASEKNIALDFFKVLIKTTYSYGLSVNKKVDDEHVVSIFTQIAGIIQLYVANIYPEIDMDSRKVFDITVDSIIFNFRHNKF